MTEPTIQNGGRYDLLRHNALLKSGHKSVKIDACRLAELLRRYFLITGWEEAAEPRPHNRLD